MDLQIRTHRPNQPDQPQVLDQDRIQPHLGDLAHRLLDHGQLAGKSQDVQGHIASHTSTVQQPHHIRQLLDGEIRRAIARIQSDLQTKIDRVGAILDRRSHRIHVPSGSEQLDRAVGAAHLFHQDIRHEEHPVELLRIGRILVVGNGHLDHLVALTDGIDHVLALNDPPKY